MPTSYAQRKAIAVDTGQCIQCQDEPHTDNSLHCERHEQLTKAAKRKSNKRRRRRRKSQCGWCSRTSGKNFLCKVCSTRKRISRVSSVGVSAGGDNRSDRIAARTAVDADNRVRYHGQPTRGGMERKVVDLQDFDEAIKLLVRARAGYALATADGAVPKAERKAAIAVALSVADHGVRFVLNIEERNGYEGEGLHAE